MPVMQIVDRGSIPEKKAYPPRSLYAGLVALGVSLMLTTIWFGQFYYNSYVKGR